MAGHKDLSCFLGQVIIITAFVSAAVSQQPPGNNGQSSGKCQCYASAHFGLIVPLVWLLKRNVFSFGGYEMIFFDKKAMAVA